MQTGSVGDTSTPSKVDGQRAKEEGGEFDSLLKDLAAASVASSAGMVADATGLAVRDDGEGKSARQARVEQESKQATESNTSGRCTGWADSSSIEKGVVNGRHERLVTEQAKAAEGAGKQEALPKENEPANGKHEAGDAAKAKDIASSKAVSDQTQKVPSKAEARETQPVQTKRNEPPAGRATNNVSATGAAKTNVSSRPVPSASAVRTVSAAGAVRSAASTQSPAQAMAQMLSGRGGVESAKAPTAGQSVGGETRGETGKQAEAKTQDAGANKGTETSQSKPANSVESAMRARFRQLVKSIRMNAGAKSSSATIRLDPPELGRMRIDVRMVENSMQVRVETSNNQARDLVSSRANELVAALREQGVDVAKFEVSGNSAVDGSNYGLGGGQSSESNSDHSAQESGEGSVVGAVSEALENDVAVEEQESSEELVYAGVDSRLDICI